MLIWAKESLNIFCRFKTQDNEFINIISKYVLLLFKGKQSMIIGNLQ